MLFGVIPTIVLGFWRKITKVKNGKNLGIRAPTPQCREPTLRRMTRLDPDTFPGFPGWSRLVKSHCTIPREHPMEPHFKKKK